MKDEIYDGMFRPPDPDPTALVVLLFAVLTVILMIAFGAHAACEGEACADSIWVLRIGEDEVAEFDTLEECVAWASELEKQSTDIAIECEKKGKSTEL